MNNQPIHITLEEWEQIEAFLNGSLTAEAEQAFRLQLEKDNVLAAKVEQVRLSILTVEEAGLREDMESFHARLQQQPVIAIEAHRKTNVKKWLAIAAVFIAVCIATMLYLQQPSKNERLFSTYYKADPGLSTTMSQTDDYTFEKAMVEYKTKNYTKAIDSWQLLLKDNPDSDTLNYFIGSAYLALNKTATAIPYFENITLKPGSEFVSDACWYLGLALIKTGRVEEGKKQIAKSERPEKDELLQQIH